ncbi:uracil phosphoribosyltransferase [Cecembia lonarensis]|uniref:Uracil phosphoribosyltransferase n=1 Tax=Cecembia lonarensis (strain CCUG 58316 / KCTC 22772 / LW9) TaxID=1225176 RepID=K1L9Q5_CECL9|nr:uracil phosphoribosyltransferase [Cecembia lonarensis]EKB48952.1 Uracil phosphoribosyltransferase [Cecembia lonarensis LW9]
MFILDKDHSLALEFMSEIRNVHTQHDRWRFRKNLERLGEIMSYEISKSLDYQEATIKTPLAETQIKKLKEKPVLISVLRAAIPFYQGFLNYFDQSDSGFVGAYRRSEKEELQEVEIDFLYQATPNLEGREVILIDPMLATGKSFVKTIQNLLANGTPSMIHIASVIAAPEGVAYIQNHIELPYKIWTVSLDDHLNNKSYIVPGLGDAGDLCFGDKV